MTGTDGGLLQRPPRIAREGPDICISELSKFRSRTACDKSLSCVSERKKAAEAR